MTPMMEKVSVSKGLLIGLAAALAASLLALAFLLGRSSGSGTPTNQPEGRQGQGIALVPPGPEPRATDNPGPPATDEATPQPTPAGKPSSDAERAGVTIDPVRADVAAYLQAVDQIQPGKMSGDAEGAATEMAAALAKGDMSGLDEMVRQTEAAKERLAALTPPAPCAAYHRESLRNLDDAAEMLRSLKKAMESPDPAPQLADVASRAAALRSRTEELQKEDLALRQRYGLTR